VGETVFRRQVEGFREGCHPGCVEIRIVMGLEKKIESIKTIITIANSSECCENIVKAKQLLKKNLSTIEKNKEFNLKELALLVSHVLVFQILQECNTRWSF
jgi:ribosomal protein L22